MRKVMEMTFAGEDAELLVVENGELALERGAAFAPNVAFIDASLPGIDGYEVTRALKGDPGLSGTAVVLMASQHRPLDAARASEVGADDHILKPFDTQEAIDKANALVGQTEAAGFSDMPSIPVARPATTPPRPVAQRSHRPTPPPLPVSSGMQPAAQRLSGTPISGAQVSVSPSAAPSLHSSAPPAKIVSAPAPARDPSSAPPTQFSSAPPAQVSSAPPTQVSSTPPGSPLEAAGASEALSHSVVARLETLGLTPDQVEGVLKLSAEVVERVVWEVVPDLAEAMIREELHRLIGD